MHIRASQAVLMLSLVVACVGIPATARAQPGDAPSWAAHVSNQYRVLPNETYHEVGNWEGKLDLYLPRSASGPVPVMMYIHGGGWVRRTKDVFVLQVVPWLEMGWAVVNVEYRISKEARAPAAVEDCLCALRWVIRNAEEYNFDTSRIVTSGHSAGGHLSLTTGMVPASAGLDRDCLCRDLDRRLTCSSGGDEELRVAAIINWFGITDVGDLLDGPNEKSYAVEWFGSLPDRFEIAERVSPLTYVRSGLPPVLTIHGTADSAVPYAHATRLHDALEAAGVPNHLHTVPGGRHGGFTKDETLAIWDTIRAFLGRHHLSRVATEN